MLELLAPAKDKICAKAAIDFGADAVYIGASSFGARKSAGNSIEDIEEIVHYAHKFNVKIFVTINTIIEDKNLSDVQKLIYNLDKINVDGIIIQDFKILKLNLPENLSIHASTQCDNRSLAQVKLLENSGFSRVILARELSIDEIKNIKQNSNIELEVFIHGALCVCYSGKCYLSESIGHRSANKGDCAQPCRKKYTLIDDKGKIYAKDKYLLSLKDFNASNYIQNFAEIGITSLKIEGRLKDENYVKNIVAYYRNLIDKYSEKTSSGEITFDFEPNLEKTFNRGFCDYFLNGRKKDICNLNSPKSTGEKIGKISSLGKNYFQINSKKELHPQDGLCFYFNNELYGCLVNKIDYNKIFPNKMDNLKIGTEIFRNSDVEFEKILKNSKTKRKINATIEFLQNSVNVIDFENNKIEVPIFFEEISKHPEQMKINIEKQFKKSGDSIFNIKDVKINCEKLPHLPISRLNELRRELLEKLEKLRLNNYKRTKSKKIIPQNISQTFLKHPLMQTKYCLKFAFDMCKSPTKLYLIDEKNKRYNLDFDCKNCQMIISSQVS